MDASLDLSRWNDPPRGVGYRRWTIVYTGLQQFLRLRLVRILLLAGWGAGLLLAVAGFVFSQSVASGGWVESAAANLGPRAQALSSALAGLVLLYPDVCIDGWFTLIFWLHSYLAFGLCMVALTVMIPRLITRDRASNALTVYLSRPLTSADYLIGKLGMITGILVLLWTGPLLFGWLLSVAFAPGRDFIVYSFSPLLRALCFHGIALITLAALALGVSAVSRTSRNTMVLWIGLWLILGAMSKPPHAPLWLKRASFAYDLGEMRQGILRLDAALSDASGSLPLLDQRFAQNLDRMGKQSAANDFNGSLGSLGVFVVLSSFVFLRRLRAE